MKARMMDPPREVGLTDESTARGKMPTVDADWLAFGVDARARTWNGDLARELQRLGYGELWANDTSRGSGLDTLADAARTTTRLALAVGVLGLSAHPPAAIAARVAELGLPRERLTVGLGTGNGRSLDAVRAGVAALRAADPRLTVAVAAIGPRMAELGGQIAEVVLLNWMGPRLAAERRRAVQRAAVEAGRPEPRVAAYVRVAIGRGSEERLAGEQDRYLGYGGSYARVISAQVEAGEGRIGIASAEPGGVPAALTDYRDALDTVVVRGLPADDTLDDWLAVARAATLRP
jgi:alkanesulfonate monooxygenase SsuD/methylene tetrahydromethanopterin reductase-like flavin-dependent oxidoreductase (luciferase family)